MKRCFHPRGSLRLPRCSSQGAGELGAGRHHDRARRAKATCAHPAGWRALANRIDADVYCPGGLPDPLVGRSAGTSNNINSVSKDRSYLESFIWQDTDTPGTERRAARHPPRLPGPDGDPDRASTGLKDKRPTPCFAGAHGHVTENGIKTTLYTVNQDADEWHLLLLWHHKGGLYILSEHLAPPLDYRKVVAYLKQELGSLVSSRRPTRLSLTRRQALGGARPECSGPRGSTSCSTSSPARHRSGRARRARASRAAPAPGDQGRPPERRRGARAAAPPRGDDGEAEGRPAGTLQAEGMLESLLASLDADDDDSGRPRRHGRVGLPYFRRLVPGAATAHLPIDRRAGKPAVQDARTFPSDPNGTVLEANEIAILLRSDYRPHIDDAVDRPRSSGLLSTDEAAPRLRRRLARRRVTRCRGRWRSRPGSRAPSSSPKARELFLGFTSTQKGAFGPGRIANFETSARRSVAAATSAAARPASLARLEDLEAWYGTTTSRARDSTSDQARPTTCADGTQASARGPETSTRP